MADNRGVWGIDIGQAGLKAIRLRREEGSDRVIADAFDYVQHPKILSQPDAIPEQLIPQALEKFLERNDVKRDKIAISVSGQNALARFIQLPPVEASKISEIVKYEARQQIPFALDDVIWDYQKLGGGVEDSGFMLEAEVGLFAMKRELVMQQLNPFTQAGLEVELIQIAPLALYSYLSYDVLGIRPTDEVAAMDEFTIVLDMGADNTTLLVSNGEKIWIRNVPIGGNHFTRELTKEMKLTFAKAEHLKCNATKSPDPRAVFQALRPIFNNYVSEIQRSIGYFSSVNRDAKISRVIGLGNGFKLAGMQKFLQQNLQYDVQRAEGFTAIVGDGVLNAPMFSENVLSFGVSYGLALQAMGLSRMKTSLLPPEIATARKIRRKKPWAVSAAAALLFGLATSVFGYSYVYNSVNESRFGDAIKHVGSLEKETSDLKINFEKEKANFDQVKSNGDALTKRLETRELWMELYKAVNECLPRDESGTSADIDINLQNRMSLKSIKCEKQLELSEWFASLDRRQSDFMSPDDEKSPPRGEGYVVMLEGTHFHHEEDTTRQGAMYVRQTLLENLKKWTLPGPPGSPPVPVGQLGISHARLVDFEKGDLERRSRSDTTYKGRYTQRWNRRSRNRDDDDRPSSIRGPAGALDLGEMKEEEVAVRETSFIVEFAWKPTPPAQRPKEKPAAQATPAAPKEEE
ncbi:MAG: type IV pilus assembly protein PilM [Planctomycetaceae bacterium]